MPDILPAHAHNICLWKPAMNRSAYLTSLRIFSVCLTIAASWGNPATAQEPGKRAEQADAGSQSDWYYGSEAKKAPVVSIARQKSLKRAEQRMARLEAMRWYGFSASRPTASGMPFTSSYSPSWTRPGGRPFAWYTGGGPGVVINRPYYRSYRY